MFLWSERWLSQVLGASWYLLAIERDVSCWEKVCNAQGPCQYRFLDCRRMDKSMEALRQSWVQSSNVTLLCSPNSNFYEYGIYGDALNSGATSSKFFNKYFYCLWWGLQNLRSAPHVFKKIKSFWCLVICNASQVEGFYNLCSCLGQNLQTSTFVGEISFAILIAVLGLVLFALLIGNMQVSPFPWKECIRNAKSSLLLDEGILPSKFLQRMPYYYYYYFTSLG